MRFIRGANDFAIFTKAFLHVKFELRCTNVQKILQKILLDSLFTIRFCHESNVCHWPFFFGWFLDDKFVFFPNSPKLKILIQSNFTCETAFDCLSTQGLP